MLNAISQKSGLGDPIIVSIVVLNPSLREFSLEVDPKNILSRMFTYHMASSIDGNFENDD